MSRPYQAKKHVVEILKKHEAVLHGDFLLASGARSNIYVDLRRAICTPDFPVIGETLASLIWQEFMGQKQYGDQLTIAGVAEAGIPVMMSVIGSEIARRLNWKGGWVPKQPKKHGVGLNWSGPTPQNKIVLVEDVITTGESAHRAASQINAELVVCILNRTGVEEIAGARVISLLTLEDVS